MIVCAAVALLLICAACKSSETSTDSEPRPPDCKGAVRKVADQVKAGRIREAERLLGSWPPGCERFLRQAKHEVTCAKTPEARECPKVEKPLTLDVAKAMTPEERAMRLQRDCYSSGICNDDTLDLLLKAAASTAERTALKKIEADNARPVLKRRDEILRLLEGIERRSRKAHAAPGYGLTVECMARFRREQALLRPDDGAVPARDLDEMALTIPGVGLLRSALVRVSLCMSCGDIAPQECDAARKELAAARQEIAAGK
jgi:hypothetical protein